jgi:AcrR family transcriptional regulator
MAKAKAIPLTPDRMEEEALELIAREGLAAFSLRKLAQALGCQAMSLYHHYPSKAHLMDALLDRIIRSAPMPPADLPWQERLARIARDFRERALAHPEFFPYMATHRMNTRAGLAWLDQVLGIFRDGGFDEENAARMFRIFGYFLMGAGLDETAGYARGPAAAVPVPGEEVARDYPNVAAAGPFFQPQYREQTFELGLSIFLRAARAADA